MLLGTPGFCFSSCEVVSFPANILWSWGLDYLGEFSNNWISSSFSSCHLSWEYLISYMKRNGLSWRNRETVIPGYGAIQALSKDVENLYKILIWIRLSGGSDSFSDLLDMPESTSFQKVLAITAFCTRFNSVSHLKNTFVSRQAWWRNTY